MTVVVLRLLGFIVLLVAGGAVGLALVTKDRRWLRFAWQVVKYSLFVAALVAAFLVLERLILAI